MAFMYLYVKPNKDFLQSGEISTLILFAIDIESISMAYIRKTGIFHNIVNNHMQQNILFHISIKQIFVY